MSKKFLLNLELNKNLLLHEIYYTLEFVTLGNNLTIFD